MITAEIQKMSAKDKITLMEEIWDSLLRDNHRMQSPDWHKDILKERLLKVENGSAEYISINDLKSKK